MTEEMPRKQACPFFAKISSPEAMARTISSLLPGREYCGPEREEESPLLSAPEETGKRRRKPLQFS